MVTASSLHHLCTTQDPRLHETLTGIYGADQSLIQERMTLLANVVATFLESYGDDPIRVFRCPGRINLRGMHVDTHGGYLNLMTHQREVFIAVSAEDGTDFQFCNVESQFEPVRFDGAKWNEIEAFGRDWQSFITDPAIQGPVLERRGHWANYLEGCVARVQQHWRDRPLTGLRGVVGSDLTRGAALSSSTALSMALIKALTACNNLNADDDTLIRLGKEAEWYTGARGGMSDQAAMVLGGRDELVSVAIHPDRLDTSGATRQPFPEELAVLVINSHTERSLSGAQLVEYTRNRFAYSLAMEILRQELRNLGLDRTVVEGIRYLSDLDAAKTAAWDGTRVLYACLQRIPESVEIDALGKRYDLPELEDTYERYFGTAPEALRPKRIGLRGPLLFGIAESERARVFPQRLAKSDFAGAGRLMTLGHDGDRIVDASGKPYRFDISDRHLARLAQDEAPIEVCPGIYGASSPTLDALVDSALAGGALGASLTGGGIAGTVLALCEARHTEEVVERVAERLRSGGYRELAGLAQPLDAAEARASIVPNHSVPPLGEIEFV